MSDEFEKCQAKPVCCGCGGEAKINKTSETGFAVYCEKCVIHTGLYHHEEDAIEAWNTAMGDHLRDATKMRERTAKVETVDKTVWKCAKCGQYFHATSWGRPVKFCSFCGAKLDWSDDE